MRCKRGADRTLPDPKNAWLSRMCMLENVCFDRKVRQFVYFEKRSEEYLGRIPSKEGTMGLQEMLNRTDGDRLIQLRNEEGTKLPIRIENCTIPKGTPYHNAKVHVLFEPYWPENYGHAVLDDILPIYTLMRIFDELTSG